MLSAIRLHYALKVSKLWLAATLKSSREVPGSKPVALAWKQSKTLWTVRYITIILSLSEQTPVPRGAKANSSWIQKSMEKRLQPKGRALGEVLLLRAPARWFRYYWASQAGPEINNNNNESRTFPRQQTLMVLDIQHIPQASSSVCVHFLLELNSPYVEERYKLWKGVKWGLVIHRVLCKSLCIMATLTMVGFDASGKVSLILCKLNVQSLQFICHFPNPGWSSWWWEHGRFPRLWIYSRPQWQMLPQSRLKQLPQPEHGPCTGVRIWLHSGISLDCTYSHLWHVPVCLQSSHMLQFIQFGSAACRNWGLPVWFTESWPPHLAQLTKKWTSSQTWSCEHLSPMPRGELMIKIVLPNPQLEGATQVWDIIMKFSPAAYLHGGQGRWPFGHNSTHKGLPLLPWHVWSFYFNASK